MIVSVVGTPATGGCPDKTAEYTHFVKDFVETAEFAKKCGAKLIEANFSCPNVAHGGKIYQDEQTVRDIASGIIQAIGDIPLIIKVGTYEDVDQMRKIFKTAANAKVRAINGINTVSMNVVKQSTNEPALGASRLSSGVCGGPIRKIALDYLAKAKQIVEEEKLNITLIGCGGITQQEHFDEFLKGGAKVAMTATGMMWGKTFLCTFLTCRSLLSSSMASQDAVSSA